MKGLQGKTALVTGASRGIGRAIALRLAEAGAIVGIHYGERRSGAEETLARIEAEGGSGFVIGANLSSLAAISAMFDEIKVITAAHHQGALDILVNNAGIGPGGSIETTDELTFDTLYAIDVKAPFFVMQGALPLMPDGGRIINISSVVATAAYPRAVAYAAAKAALTSMTISVAVGLAPRQITVNAVAPGATETDFIGGAPANPDFMAMVSRTTPMGRLGKPEEIAGIVAFLASSEAGWITGQLIAASGGMHL